MNPIVEIHQYWFRHLRVSWADHNPEAKQLGTDAIQTSLDYNVFTGVENPKNYRMEMKIKLETMDKGKPVGYTVEAIMIGLFEVIGEMPSQHTPFIMRANAVGILYGSLRGVVANVSATCEGGPFYLPSINPNDIVINVENAKAAARAKTETDAKIAEELAKKSAEAASKA